jgi:xylulokinase
VEYSLYSPHPGWSEKDPEDWWRAIKEVLGRVAVDVEDEIVGLGLTGQQHGSVFLDAEDRVIRRALLWNDQRTEAQCREISEKVGDKRFARVTGSLAIPAVQASKILWLRDEEPENFDRVSHVLLPKDYVRLLLTGEYASDASDASGPLLLTCKAGITHPSSWKPSRSRASGYPGSTRAPRSRGRL